jgi:putative protease
MIKPELLAPAGDLEKCRIALLYGADAVYVGGQSFSLRARASHFSLEDIQTAVTMAHAMGKKLYVTVNMIPYEADLAGLKEYLQALESFKVDAIIVAAASVIRIAQAHTSLPIHLSTQQSTTNHLALNYWAGQGLERVVLGREVSLHELREIAAVAQAELEVFIHGAMCVSYSGKCTLSNTMTGRDANRGGCAQSCRWDYTLVQQGIEEPADTAFSMSAKDLETVKYISSLIDVGVHSLKIEGRMKSIHYIATVVNTYRRLIDAICDDVALDLPAYVLNIKKAENRLTSHGFMEGLTTINEQLFNARSENPSQNFIGIIKAYDEQTGWATIEQRNKFSVGDTIEVFSPTQEPLTFVLEELWDETHHPMQAAAHPKALVYGKIPFVCEPYALLRKVNLND